MKEKENNESLFHDAAMESALSEILAKNTLPTKNDDEEKENIYDKENKEILLNKIKERVEKGDSQWDVLSSMITGGFTERFMKAMVEMSDKDFVRNYIKIIEHFKPKLIRSEGGKSDLPDTTINIQTMVINEKGEKVIKTLEINDDKENE